MHSCIKAHSWLNSRECHKPVCACVSVGQFGRNDTGRPCKSVSDRGSDRVSSFFPPCSPPTVQSIQLLSPQGSRQSIKASGCILLTCAAPLMNSQHDPGWQAGNGCNKDCFCMLFASLINHLAVQQIREPHGNLISHGKGEEEESSGGKRELLVAGSLYFIPLFLQRSSSARCVGAEWRGNSVFFFFPLTMFLSHKSSVKPLTCLYLSKSINNIRQCVDLYRGLSHHNSM